MQTKLIFAEPEDEVCPVCTGAGFKHNIGVNFCDGCKSAVKNNVYIVVIDVLNTKNPRKPYRTGSYFLVHRSLIVKLFSYDKELILAGFKKKLIYVDYHVAREMGFEFPYLKL